ncbi:MAG: copper chaperone PCu(A)C [Candidatus Kapaibacterium sp.]
MNFCKSLDVRLVPLLFFLIVAGCSETKEESGTKSEDAAEQAPQVCTSGSIQIEDIWITPAAKGGTSGLYGTIRFEAEGADSLIEILCSETERVELHEMIPGEGEEMKMVRMTTSPVLQKGKPVTLALGGKHGMLVNLKQELKVGDSVEIGFRMGSGDTVRCTARVSTSSPAEARKRERKMNGPGAKLYTQYCSACHGSDGAGQTGIFPPLTGSEFFKDKDRTIDAIVNGLQGEITVQGVTYNGVMPPLPDTYDDETVADVINYVLARFGENAWQTTPEEVAGIRDRD